MSGSGYTLILCEKPDAARKVAEALTDGGVKSTKNGGVEVLEFRRGDTEYVVCSAIGHLYRVSDSFNKRDVFPVFDLEWYPANLVDKTLRGVQKRIAVIKSRARDASRFINACDYDTEGETIGENLLRYACGGVESSALRAKFSTLTKDEIVSSFEEASITANSGLGSSGRTRHILDFIWGINLSRALSQAANLSSLGYKTISMGRVQGPTLAFVAEREADILGFVPMPYWTVTAFFEKDGITFSAASTNGRFAIKKEAESVKTSCQGREGTVFSVAKTVYKEGPPPPFNTGDLQHEAYQAFRFPPSKTLQIAEHLYLGALISYPRTSSQKLPPSIGYRKILSKLASTAEYGGLAQELLNAPTLAPKQGERHDRAHPAIYPTGERPRGRPLMSQERSIYDLIVRRFLACFGDDAIRQRLSLKIDVNGNEFGISGRETLRSGWLKYYGRYAATSDRPIPKLAHGDILAVMRVDCDEKLESPPSRYNQSSLLEKMEKEEIGTKATRAETISTLITRGYVTGDPLAATDLGLSVIETMREFCPKIVSVELTRETERELEEIEERKIDSAVVIERTIDVLSKQIEDLKSNQENVGAELAQSAAGTESVSRTTGNALLGKCPVCQSGSLIVIRSRKTRKRFVGCTNYRNGCRASAPLPQRGGIKAASKPCAKCGWPIVSVWSGRFPWKLCVNPSCETKKNKNQKSFVTQNAMQTLQKTS